MKILEDVYQVKSHFQCTFGLEGFKVSELGEVVLIHHDVLEVNIWTTLHINAVYLASRVEFA